eukprot:TRINITY_DN1287_c0_g2_i1.p1 TRINITY_DN1287_c0_g2~~TRINITY_DN1287_c0_g2_i1.p1  ORF type:complete len:516 (-),score=125.15 TRINITY_DN1287_c0_g2_i1:272-1819(-)
MNGASGLQSSINQDMSNNLNELVISPIKHHSTKEERIINSTLSMPLKLSSPIKHSNSDTPGRIPGNSDGNNKETFEGLESLRTVNSGHNHDEGMDSSSDDDSGSMESVLSPINKLSNMSIASLISQECVDCCSMAQKVLVEINEACCNVMDAVANKQQSLLELMDLIEIWRNDEIRIFQSFSASDLTHGAHERVKSVAKLDRSVSRLTESPEFTRSRKLGMDLGVSSPSLNVGSQDCLCPSSFTMTNDCSINDDIHAVWWNSKSIITKLGNSMSAGNPLLGDMSVDKVFEKLCSCLWAMVACCKRGSMELARLGFQQSNWVQNVEKQNSEKIQEQYWIRSMVRTLVGIASHLCEVADNFVKGFQAEEHTKFFSSSLQMDSIRIISVLLDETKERMWNGKLEEWLQEANSPKIGNTSTVTMADTTHHTISGNLPSTDSRTKDAFKYINPLPLSPHNQNLGQLDVLESQRILENHSSQNPISSLKEVKRELKDLQDRLVLMSRNNNMNVWLFTLPTI